MKDSSQWTLLHHAAFEGNLKIVDILLKTKIEIESVNAHKQTALHLAVQQGFFDITKKLIERGANINVLDDEKNNILHYCSQNDHIELLKYLLEKSPTYLILEKNIFGKAPKDLVKDKEIGTIFNQFTINNTNVKEVQGKINKIQIYDTTTTKDYLDKKFNKDKEKYGKYQSINRNNININISTNIGNFNNIVNSQTKLISQTNSNKKFRMNKSPKGIKKDNLNSNNNTGLSKKENENYVPYSSIQMTEEFRFNKSPSLTNNLNNQGGNFISTQNSQILSDSVKISSNKNSKNLTDNVIHSDISSKNIKFDKNSKNTEGRQPQILSVKGNSTNYKLNYTSPISSTNDDTNQETKSSNFSINNQNNSNSNSLNQSSRTNNKQPDKIVKIPITQINLNNNTNQTPNSKSNKDKSNKLTTPSQTYSILQVSNSNHNNQQLHNNSQIDYENMSTKRFKIGGASKTENKGSSKGKNNVLKNALTNNSKKELTNQKNNNIYNNLIQIDLYNNDSSAKKIVSENFNKNANVPKKCELNLVNKDDKSEKLKIIMSHKTFDTPQKIISKSKLDALKEKKNEENAKNNKNFVNTTKNNSSNTFNYISGMNSVINQKDKNSSKVEVKLQSNFLNKTENIDHNSNSINSNIYKSNNIKETNINDIYKKESSSSKKKFTSHNNQNKICLNNGNKNQIYGHLPHSAASSINNELDLYNLQQKGKNSNIRDKSNKIKSNNYKDKQKINNHCNSNEESILNKVLSNKIIESSKNIVNESPKVKFSSNQLTDKKNSDNCKQINLNELNKNSKYKDTKENLTFEINKKKNRSSIDLNYSKSKMKISNEMVNDDKNIIQNKKEENMQNKFQENKNNEENESENEKNEENDNINLNISNRQIIDSDSEESEEEEDESSSNIYDENDNEIKNVKSNIGVGNNTEIINLENEDIADDNELNENSKIDVDVNKTNSQNVETSSIEEKVYPTSFICHALLGKGSFGEVYLVEKINSKVLYAMKVLSKDKIMGKL